MKNPDPIRHLKEALQKRENEIDSEIKRVRLARKEVERL